MSSGHPSDRPVPEALAASEVLAEDGSKLCLGTLWTQRPVVLAFVRHFG